MDLSFALNEESDTLNTAIRFLHRFGHVHRRDPEIRWRNSDHYRHEKEPDRGVDEVYVQDSLEEREVVVGGCEYRLTQNERGKDHRVLSRGRYRYVPQLAGALAVHLQKDLTVLAVSDHVSTLGGGTNLNESRKHRSSGVLGERSKQASISAKGSSH